MTGHTLSEMLKLAPMEEGRYERLFWVLAGGFFCFQLLYLWINPYDLAPDEAYYWTWSKRLAWGYFSKPPLVAWVMALSTALGGDSPFFVRLGAPVFSFVTYIALFYLAKGLFNPRVALWSFLLAVTTVGGPLGGLIMTIDPPLIAFWALSLLFLWRAAEGKEAYWYLGGLTLGGGLLSKYTMGALVPSVFAYLLLAPRARGWLRKKEPYLWVVIGSLIFLPHLLWEWRHGLVAFRHTTSLVQSRGLSPWTFLEFVGTQFGLLTPLTFCLVAYGLWRGTREVLRGGPDPYLFPFCSSAPLLGLCLAISFTAPCYANWAAPAYLGAFVLAAASVLEAPWPERRKRRLLGAAVALGGAICLLTYGMDLLRALPIPQRDLPTSRIMGWRKLGQEVKGLRERHGGAPFLISHDRRFVAELAFYVPGAFPRVYFYNPKGYPRSQFDLWGGLQQEVGSDAIYVTKKGRAVPEPLRRAFERCEWAEDVEVTYRGKFVKGFSLYLCEGFKGLPLTSPRGGDRGD